MPPRSAVARLRPAGVARVGRESRVAASRARTPPLSSGAHAAARQEGGSGLDMVWAVALGLFAGYATFAPSNALRYGTVLTLLDRRRTPIAPHPPVRGDHPSRPVHRRCVPLLVLGGRSGRGGSCCARPCRCVHDLRCRANRRDRPDEVPGGRRRIPAGVPVDGPSDIGDEPGRRVCPPVHRDAFRRTRPQPQLRRLRVRRRHLDPWRLVLDTEFAVAVPSRHLRGACGAHRLGDRAVRHPWGGDRLRLPGGLDCGVSGTPGTARAHRTGPRRRRRRGGHIDRRR